jgi:peptide chain release factor 1
VLPEAEEVDVKIEPQDVRIDVYRSSGHGGQSVNTTDSAVRITHPCHGPAVTCQTKSPSSRTRSRPCEPEVAPVRQDQPRAFGLDRQFPEKSGGQRRPQRKNPHLQFPQNRVTDHRIGLTLYNLGAVMEGDLDGLVGPLLEREYAASMEKSNALLDLPQEAR